MRTALSIVFCLIAGLAWSDEVKVNVAAPSGLPGVTSEMRSAGFWVARHPSPDELIMTGKSITEFNRRLTAGGFTEDLARVPAELPGVKVRAQLSGIIDGLKKRTLYGSDGKAVSPDFIAGFDREVDSVPDKVAVLCGFIVKSTALRLLPTAQPLYAEPGDVDFDEVQNSGLELGEPVVVLAHSRDHQWLYVHDAISSGWVTVASVARAPHAVFAKRLLSFRPLIITSARADLFLDKEMTEYLTAVRMGTTLAFKSLSPAFWEVDVPTVSAEGDVKFVAAYIPKKDASAGPLAFTPRVIYEQAFKMLDAPYGWGDMNGGQDCSRFIQMVFATVGLQLPRNSAEQGKVGAMLGGFSEKLTPAEKSAIIVKNGLGAATILRLQGHIVLYLGSYSDKPFAIHSAWAYREPMPDGTQRARVIGRVAVTSLDLGAGSSKGSLLERTLSARLLKN
ncbi:MAG: SH3 domain-containing protein [Candidatus Omnitrophica bacterium]|nr:SH3 domain-containing protein [Candidatus Omnitrophota bacterium]